MASPSFITSRNYKFDVFLSFCGDDVPKAFPGHLYKQFNDNGITVFDDQGIERTEKNAFFVIQAIRESRISIVILSKNYALSTWRLDELVEILEGRKSMGQIVKVIFYGVDPSNVRKQTGDFGSVFKKTCLRTTDEEKQKWIKALTDVGNILGEHQWDNEAKMIEEIARDVSNKLNASVMQSLSDLDGTSSTENKDLLKGHGSDNTYHVDFPSEEEALDKNLETLEKEVQLLNAMRNELLKKVSKEEGRGLQVLPRVKRWISRVEEIELKASSLLDKSISELHKLSKLVDCSQTTHNYRHLVFMSLKEVETLKSEGHFELVVDKAPLLHMKKVQPLQPILPREKLLEKAWDRVMDKNIGTLVLYGMGGVGKTTLLTQIHTKSLEPGSKFDHVFFVVVPEEVKSLQDKIARRKRTGKDKASEIYEVINTKRCLFLLDDMHWEVDLEEIGVPLPSRENGCKIVFTTRTRELRGKKWIDVDLEVPCLTPQEGWDLFQMIVQETTLKSHQEIPKLARLVARKCRGFPLALYLIGLTMSSKKTAREWYHAIHVLVSSAAEFSDMEDKILPILKFVYDNLPGENIKLCFQYCALFRENSAISKEKLVDCLIGERIIGDEQDREIAEIKGYEMITDLVRMGLLMEDESGYGVRMHEVVREMALWIASDFGKQKETFVMRCGNRIQEMPEVNDWRMVRRISVTSTQIEDLADSPHCSQLTTLFLQENSNLKAIVGDFFRWMESLVLLDLSFNSKLDKLPDEVSYLVSLRILNLSSTSIERLPLGLKELTRLIHLDLDNTNELRDIKVIASLLNLQVLRLLGSSVAINIRSMEDIQLLKNLKELSLTVRGSAVLELLLSIQRLASCIRRLHLTGITITNEGVLWLNDMFRLCELIISDCSILEITNDWRSTVIQSQAVHSGNIEKFPQFQNIRTVYLFRCRGLRDLTWLLFAPSLDNLSLIECPHIEEIINKEKAMAQLGHTSEQPFQNLTRLSLDDLPKLKNIYWTPLPFPVLEYIYLSGCPKLRRLPFNSDTAKGNQFQTVSLDRKWIEGAEWEDDATKNRFSELNNRGFTNMAKDQKIDGLASESHPLKAATSPSVPTSPARAEVTVSPGSRWKKGRLLGTGSSGHVYLGFNSESGEMCAMKEVTLCSDDPKSRKSAQQLGQEVAVLSRLRHPNIVQYYGSETVDDKLYIYLEYVSGGSIYKLLQECGQFKENAIRNYTQQILSGLAYLHAKNTIHRDIKGANILVDPQGRVKLADFGMAKHITAQSGYLSFKGSPYWMAPEVINNSNGSNLAVDIWSLGCTVLEMATTKPPWSQYEGVAAMFKIGNSKELPDIPDHLSEEGKDFVRKCLQRNPVNRPTASQLLDHAFVRNAMPMERPMNVPSSTMRSLEFGHTRSLPCLDSEDSNNYQQKGLKPGSGFSISQSPRNMSCPISPVGSSIFTSHFAPP